MENNKWISGNFHTVCYQLENYFRRANFIIIIPLQKHAGTPLHIRLTKIFFGF